MGYIYTLKDPTSDIIRYVGQTKRHPKKRYFQHKYQWKRCKGKMSHLNCWIKSLYEVGRFPSLSILESDISDDKLNEREIHHIAFLKSIGEDLTNANEGGGYYMSNRLTPTQMDKWKKSRKDSKEMKERNERHSQNMKQIHASISHIGFKAWNKDKLRQLNKETISKRFKKVRSTDMSGNTMEFESIKSAARYHDVFDTHISKICKGKSKSGRIKGISFEYI